MRTMCACGKEEYNSTSVGGYAYDRTYPVQQVLLLKTFVAAPRQARPTKVKPYDSARKRRAGTAQGASLRASLVGYLHARTTQ